MAGKIDKYGNAILDDEGQPSKRKQHFLNDKVRNTDTDYPGEKKSCLSGCLTFMMWWFIIGFVVTILWIIIGIMRDLHFF